MAISIFATRDVTDSITALGYVTVVLFIKADEVRFERKVLKENVLPIHLKHLKFRFMTSDSPRIRMAPKMSAGRVFYIRHP